MIALTPEQEFFWKLRYPMSFVNVIGCVKIVGDNGYEYEGELYGFVHELPETAPFLLTAGRTSINLYVEKFVLVRIHYYDVENNVLLDINKVNIFSCIYEIGRAHV